MFDLSLGEENIMFEEKGYSGKIVIDQFEEFFFANSSFLKKEDYYKNWLKSIDNLFEFSKTLFLKNVYDPKYANFYIVYSCDLIDNIIYVQNRIIFYEDHPLKEVLHSNLRIGDINFIDDEGNRISTWKTDMKSINDFKDRIIQKLSSLSSNDEF